MPRKKPPIAENARSDSDARTSAGAQLPTPDKSWQQRTNPGNESPEKSRERARSFKATLSVADKGVTIGARNGHDWVVSFPGDPGKATKDKLLGTGFTYHNFKWKVFTNAANRDPVESLVKQLRQEHGDELTVNEYPARQVVLAFDAPPAEEIVSHLKGNDWYYRPDRTWNAEDTAANRTFAQDLVKSLPVLARPVAAAR